MGHKKWWMLILSMAKVSNVWASTTVPDMFTRGTALAMSTEAPPTCCSSVCEEKPIKGKLADREGEGR